MIKFRHLAVAAIGIAGWAGAAFAQAGVPTPGTVNGASAASNYREETASYNSVIGKVGSDPVAVEKSKRAARAKAVPAAPADVIPGATVRDIKGETIGKVESIDGDSAILVFASGKIRFPIIGFGKDQQGLLISLTTKEFLALVEKAAKGG